MSHSALQACLQREVAQAAAAAALDEDLATYHGLSWSDFVLLDQLSHGEDGMPEAELARRLGLTRSRLLVRTRPLVKLGWLSREVEGHRLTLRPSARGMLSQARETASAVCERIEVKIDS